MAFSSWRGVFGIINPTINAVFAKYVSPIDATQVQQLLARSAATPRDVIERYNSLGEPQKQKK